MNGDHHLTGFRTACDEARISHGWLMYPYALHARITYVGKSQARMVEMFFAVAGTGSDRRQSYGGQVRRVELGD